MNEVAFRKSWCFCVSQLRFSAVAVTDPNVTHSDHLVNDILSDHFVNGTLSDHFVNDTLSDHFVNDTLSDHFVNDT